MAEPLLEVRDLKKHFPVKGSGLWGRQRFVKAVDGVTFTVKQGETLGLVGESGCGKTTTSKLILAAERATAGVIEFEGRDIAVLPDRQLQDYRRKVQVVFQDPYSSLSPRMRVGEIIAEPMEAHETLSRRDMQSRVGELFELVGLRPDMARLFPHEFSGGQRQRLAIARALSTNARLVVLDEPVSALDVSIRAHIIGLLEDIQARLGGQLPVYRARSCRCLASQQPDGRHVSRQARRGGRQPRSLRQSASPLYQGAVRCLAAIPSRRAEGRDCAHRRGAERPRPSARLPVSSAVSVRDASLLGGRADAGRAVSRTYRGVSSLLRDASRPVTCCSRSPGRCTRRRCLSCSWRARRAEHHHALFAQRHQHICRFQWSPAQHSLCDPGE